MTGSLMLLVVMGTADAATFTFDITNNSGEDWLEGVAAVMPESGSPNALMSIGDTPTSGPEFNTYAYIDSSCDDGGEDDGDATILIDAWGLTDGVDAWIVPALAPGETTTVNITATDGDVLSFLARIDPSGDDMVMMHAIGDPLDTTVDLFNQVGQPLFNVRFDIKGYDPNTRNRNDGQASSCQPDCPVTGNNCYVALGNATSGSDAGGSQTPPVEPDYGIFPDWSLPATSWYANGAGSPTVIRRAIHDDYLLFFETRLAQTDPECPAGLWGIGYATSPDGFNWSVVGNGPIVTPTAGTYYSCVAAHPNVIIDEAGTDIHLYFKGEQGLDACDTDTPPWGCERYTGVGYRKINGITGQTTSESAEPIVSQGQVFGFPSVTRVNGSYTMLLATYPDFYQATATSPAGPWTTHPNPVMEPGVVSYAQTELFSPSLVCEGDSAPLPNYKNKSFFGGRTTNGLWGPIVDGGVGNAISSNAVNWLLGAKAFSFNDDEAWRHFEAVRVGSEYLVYFSEKDASGTLNIGLAASKDTWDDADVATDICPQPAWW